MSAIFSSTVRRVSKRFGFKEVTDDEDWNLYWTDYSVTLERVMDMKKYQVGARTYNMAHTSWHIQHGTYNMAHTHTT